MGHRQDGNTHDRFRTDEWTTSHRIDIPGPQKRGTGGTLILI